MHFRPSPLPFNTKKKKGQDEQQILSDLHLLRFNNWKPRNGASNSSGVLQSSCSCFRYLQGSLAHEEITCLPKNATARRSSKTALGVARTVLNHFNHMFWRRLPKKYPLRFQNFLPSSVGCENELPAFSLWPVQLPNLLVFNEGLGSHFQHVGNTRISKLLSKSFHLLSGCSQKAEKCEVQNAHLFLEKNR